MRTLTVIILSFCFSVNLIAQEKESEIQEYPEFSLLRSTEDYSFLANSDDHNSFWKSLKYLSLGEQSYVSLGGDIRTEFQILSNEEWEEGNNDQAMFQRFMFHSDWHLSSQVRVFAQLKHGFTVGRNGPRNILDDDVLDFHQLFVSLKVNNSTIEIGRQELKYGSRRLISVREGTNIRQSFDGVRWKYEKKNHKVDLLAYAYNPQQTEFFDNEVNLDRLIWGAYWVVNLPQFENLNFDIYYLGVRNRETRFEEGNDRELRHSLGIRHWGTKQNFHFNNEAIFQFGSFGNGNISAWTISTDISYKLPGSHNKKIGLKAEIISGDNDPSDGDLQTFNALYPRGGYFGLLAVIGPANLIDVHPSFKMSLNDRWNLSLDWDFFWRHRLSDGIYFPSGRLNLASDSSNERFIGHQPGVQLSYVANRFLELEASCFLFIAGDHIDQVSDGSNFSQFGTSINFKF